MPNRQQQQEHLWKHHQENFRAGGKQKPKQENENENGKWKNMQNTFESCKRNLCELMIC